MANKTIYPYGVGGETPSGIDIVDYTTGGNDKAASAESVKELAQYVFMGSGSFADAYDKAKTTLAYFPWLLEDTDKDGNVIKKMIWHVGNKQFIDAIGAKIDGVKNGVTVTTDTAGYMRIWDTVQYKLVSSKIYDYELHVGENNFSFDEIGGNSHVYVEFVNSSKTGLMSGAEMSVDFGGMTLTTFYSSDSDGISSGEFTRYPNLFHGFGKLKSVKRLNLVPTAPANQTPYLQSWFTGDLKLEYLQISGTITSGSISNWIQNTRELAVLDLSQLNMPITACRTGFSFLMSQKLEYLDIRGVDFSAGTSVSNFIKMSEGNTLKTIVVGNIDTSNISSSTDFLANVSGATLVCTQATPPAWGFDFINGHFTSIKVPATALTDYQEASGWSTYANIMSTYEEGEY